MSDDQSTSGGVSSPATSPAAVDPRWKLDINNNGRRNDVRPVSRSVFCGLVYSLTV